ncbi:MAG TPA: aldo/keto reductase [Dehalococcoidia bacterium]|nr:aldo/keto reductase [Dehalococcoidia bacterium]HIK88370.1 aldo/keto reductase [Dehalococcoidia bacterium]
MKLGQTNLEVSPVGTGTWQWGGAFYWGYGRGYTDEDLAGAYAASIEHGINWFDTAEIYGRGRSETILGRLTNSQKTLSNGSKIISAPLVATKFFPYPWRLHRSSLRRAQNASLRRLETKSIDLYQIHFPIRPRGYEYWLDALAYAAQGGLVKAVGVSNYSTEQTKRAHDLLAQRGVVLASNQVGYSLLNRVVESNGVLDTCRDLGVSVISYGPLSEGLLTGKYRTDNPPPLLRRLRWARKRLKMLPPLIALMNDIASVHNASASQVALNWLIEKGTLPIPGAKSAAQAADNASAMTWQLASDEFEALDEATNRYV